MLLSGLLLRMIVCLLVCYSRYVEGVLMTSGLLMRQTLLHGVWCRGNQIVVLDDAEDLGQNCVSVHHDTLFAGHLGRDCTVQLLLQAYWWPGLECDVRQYVSTCDHCHRNMASKEKPAGLLQSLPVHGFMWQWATVHCQICLRPRPLWCLWTS